jgi:hypothetical protein
MGPLAKAANEIGKEYLSQLVAKLNALVPDDRQLEAQNAAAYKMARDPHISELIAEMIRDGADQRQEKWWRDYWSGEGRYIGDLFRTLDNTGQLAPNDARELLEVCRDGVHFDQHSGIADGKPFFKPVPRFKDDIYVKAAYALVQLAGNPDVNYRVVRCQHCEQFVLVTLGKGKRGRPRSNFCSKEHGEAYASAAWRAREAAKRAAKQRRDAAKRAAAKHK